MLYAKLEKFSFNMNIIQYLGCIVEEHGVHVNPTKIQIIHDRVIPKELMEFHNMLSLANVSHRFMLVFSHIS
jgi:hypothetical protein